MILRSLLASLLLALSTPMAIATSDVVATAQQAADMLDAAADALSAAKGAQDRVSALTQTVRAYEEGLLALREGVRRAAIREIALNVEFETRRERVAKLVGALLAVERTPKPLLLLHPTGAVGSVRSAMILSDMTPALHAEAEVLRDHLTELALIQALQGNAVEIMQGGLRGAQTARAELSQAIADRVELPLRFAADPDSLRLLLENSDTLEGFAAGLADQQLDETGGDGAAFETSKGNLPYPVRGTTLRRFDEADAAGIRRPGLVLATGPLALVSAPWPATIRYRGPLLDYGNVMILEPAEGYLLVLAGLEQVYGEVGEIVRSGAPIGLMGGLEPGPQEFMVAVAEGGGAGRTETLYIELREAGKPVDPTEWFAERD